MELLAAVPSVIFGLLAIFTLVPLMRQYVEPFLKKTLGFLPLFQGPAYGVGYLTAGLILAIMTFPFIISISREALLAVPREQREAALALGATKWESTWQVVVPYARLGIIGSIFLALARALGETMAVTMVIGNDTSIHTSLLSPGYTIAAVIANEFTEATGDVYLSSLVELGLVLFAAHHGHQRRRPVADYRHHQEGIEAGLMDRIARRNIVNNVMLTLTGVCTVLTVSVLFLILGYPGGQRLAIVGLELLHQAAAVRGRNRRRHGQCHRGQRHRDLDRGRHRHSGRISGRHLPGGVRRQDVPDDGPLHRGPAERRAIHRHRNLRLDRHRGAHAPFLRLGRRLCAEPDDDPHRPAHHRTVPARRSQFACAKARWLWAPARLGRLSR